MSGTLSSALSSIFTANPSVEVDINGKKITGWTHATITASIDRVPRCFEVGIILDTQAAIANAMQQPAIVWLNHGNGKRDKILTGYVDVINDELEDENHEIIMSGRGVCCDLVDSFNEFYASASGELNTGSVADVVKNICSFYDIPVIVENPKANFNYIGMITPNLGDTAYTVIEFFARATTCLLYENGDGALVLGAAGSEPKSDTVITHQLASHSAVQLDMSQVFSDYQIFATMPFKDHTQVMGVKPPMGTASDPNFKDRVTAINGKPRKRFYRRMENFILDPHIYAAGQTPQQIYADYIKNRLNGRAQAITVSLPGWLDGQGKMWRINQLVNVLLPYQRMATAKGEPINLVVAECTYSISPEQGTMTTLRLMPATAFGVEPIGGVAPDVAQVLGQNPPATPPAKTPAAAPAADVPSLAGI